MSRHGYSDDYSGFELGRWRGIIASATRGKRGQAFFRDLVAALDAMPEKKLVKGDLETSDGAVCALGALGRHRHVEVANLDTSDYGQLGATFDVAEQLTQEVMFENDDRPFYGVTDKESARWEHMRAWALRQIRPETLVPEVAE